MEVWFFPFHECQTHLLAIKLLKAFNLFSFKSHRFSHNFQLIFLKFRKQILIWDFLKTNHEFHMQQDFRSTFTIPYKHFEVHITACSKSYLFFFCLTLNDDCCSWMTAAWKCCGEKKWKRNLLLWENLRSYFLIIHHFCTII